jgi:hypothetical protein
LVFLMKKQPSRCNTATGECFEPASDEPKYRSRPHPNSTFAGTSADSSCKALNVTPKALRRKTKRSDGQPEIPPKPAILKTETLHRSHRSHHQDDPETKLPKITACPRVKNAIQMAEQNLRTALGKNTKNC